MCIECRIFQNFRIFLIQPLCNVFYEVWYNLSVFVAPRFHIFPMGIEILLHDLHLLCCSLFCIFLHAGVKCRVYLKTIIIKVQVRQIIYLLTQTLDMFCYGITEIWCYTTFFTFELHKFKSQRQLLKFVKFCLRQMSVFQHIVHYDIPSLQRIFRMGYRVKYCSTFQGAYQYCCFFNGKFLGRTVKICFGGSLNTIGIMSEIYSVGILSQYLFLTSFSAHRYRKVYLQFSCRNPFFGFHNEYSKTRYLSHNTSTILCTYSEHILGKLLCNG